MPHRHTLDRLLQQVLCTDFTRSVATVLSSGHLPNSCDLENWQKSTMGLFHLISAVRIQNSLSTKNRKTSCRVTGTRELKPDTTILNIVLQDALPLKRNLIPEIYENLVEHQSFTTIPHHLFQRSNSGGTQRARPMILTLQHCLQFYSEARVPKPRFCRFCICSFFV